MNATDIAYVAGFFDGEGCVHIHKRCYPPGKVYYALLVTISNSKSKPLEYIKDIFGGSLRQDQDKRPNRSLMYELRLNGEKAGQLLSAVLPYLKVKGDVAKLGIEFGKLRYGTNRWVKGLRGSLPLFKAEMDKRQELYSKIRLKNQRGRISEEASHG